MGTPLFSSPETIAKNQFSEKSDAWAVGVVLHQLCCLKLPFSGKSYRKTLDAIQHGSPGPIPAQYSPELQTIISWLLAKDPERRASVRDILDMPFVRRLTSSGNSNSDSGKGKSCQFQISQRSLRNDFDNCKIYKNSNFMTKEVLDRLENSRWDSESVPDELAESMVIDKKNDQFMGKQLHQDDIAWLRERMSMAGSVKTPAKGIQGHWPEFSDGYACLTTVALKCRICCSRQWIKEKEAHAILFSLWILRIFSQNREPPAGLKRT